MRDSVTRVRDETNTGGRYGSKLLTIGESPSLPLGRAKGVTEKFGRPSEQHALVSI